MSSRDRDRHRGGDNYNNRGGGGGGGFPRGEHNKDVDHEITRSDKHRSTDEKIIRRSDKIETAADDSSKTHDIEARMPKYQAPVKPVSLKIN